MLAAYMFSLVLGGGFLALSLFGDFLGGGADAAEADLDLDMDGDSDFGGEATKILSLRTIVYALFAFGATGAVLHLLWDGQHAGLTALFAGGGGVTCGAFVSTVFSYLKKDAGALESEQSFVGMTGKVTLPIGPGSPGAVMIQRGETRHRLRARVDDTLLGPAASASSASTFLAEGQSVVVVDMDHGVAAVAPVTMKLLED